MKQVHTPGPWAASEYSDTGGYDCMTGSIFIRSSTVTGLADLDGAAYGQDACGAITAGILAEMQANARLIAAAPDLLRICEEMYAVAEFADYKLDEFEAVIAKAKGE